MSRAEKFIEDYTRNCSNLMQVPTLDDRGNIVPEAHPWLTPDQALRAVEIARDEMIEKACEYLDIHCNEVKTEDNVIAGWIDNEFINNFRKAMRNEIQDKVQRPHKKIQAICRERGGYGGF